MSGCVIDNAIDGALSTSCNEPGQLNSSFDGYTSLDPQNFDMRRFADPQNFRLVFSHLKKFGGQGAGIDGLTYKDVTGEELYEAARVVSVVLNDQTYTPRLSRRVEIPKGGGRYRTLLLQCLFDRVVSKGVQLALSSYWRERLPGANKSVQDVWLAIDAGIRQTGNTVLAIDDVANCFPTAPVEPILELHRQHFDNADLLWLVEVILRDRDGLSIITGLEQGMPYSPPAMELLLFSCLEQHAQGDLLDSLLFRYVDNLTYLVGSPEQGTEVLQWASERLSAYNMHLKREDGPPVDLRHNSACILGLEIRWEDGNLKFTIPPKAYQKLVEGLRKAHNTRHQTTTATAVVNGWLNACGPALGSKRRPETLRTLEGILHDNGFRWHRPKLDRLRKRATRAHDKWRQKSGDRRRRRGRRRAR